MGRARSMAAIVAMYVGGAVVFGILHDLFTAHASLEYFTIGHRQVVASESPVLLALVWGVLATWWMGALSGLTLALVAQLGRWPRLGWKELRWPLIWALVMMGVGAATAYATTDCSRCGGWPMPESIEGDAARAYWKVWATHIESYTSGILAVLAATWWIVVRRRHLARIPDATPLATLALRRGRFGVLGFILMSHVLLRSQVAGFYSPWNWSLHLAYLVLGLALVCWAIASRIVRARMVRDSGASSPRRGPSGLQDPSKSLPSGQPPNPEAKEA